MNRMLIFKQQQLNVVHHERGLYTIAELKEYIHFEVKRIYFIQDMKQSTGQHCHKEEQEFFIMMRGTCTAVIDWGEGRKELPFHAPSDAMYVGNYVWHGFKDFSSDAILLALSSTNYNIDRSDYIEEYVEYQKVIGELQQENSQ